MGTTKEPSKAMSLAGQIMAVVVIACCIAIVLSLSVLVVAFIWDVIDRVGT